MKDLIQNLYGKLEDWGIEPIVLAKAIGIFLILVTLVLTMVTFPVLFGILIIVAICLAIIALIYTMLL
jgi:hypothetical protein